MLVKSAIFHKNSMNIDKKNFWIVDSFADKMFVGNQAAVCLVDKFPNENIMQSVAIEFGFSETAFIAPYPLNSSQPPTNTASLIKKYAIRWFTPHSEAPLCGHATLASAYILFLNNLVSSKCTIRFNAISSGISVTAWMRDNNTVFLRMPAYQTQLMPSSVGVDEYDVLLKSAFSHIIGTDVHIKQLGLSQNCIIAEVDGNSISALKPNLEALTDLPYRALIVTSEDTIYNKYDFLLRYFAPKVGIPEDPVCGSAHCRLIPYWSKKLRKNYMTSYQVSKRGGSVICENISESGEVNIGGQAIVVVSGYIMI